jgi:CheY-like chemotaxis protein
MSQVGEQAKLLFVDDEQEFARVMAKRLGRLGYLVSIAGDGSEALRLARDTDFEVAVVDLKMAGMDGQEVLRTLLLLLPTIKVVMLTGHGSREIAEQCLQMGAFAYLNKPCAFEELVANIQRAAQEARRSR